jgi:hypothetical protein
VIWGKKKQWCPNIDPIQEVAKGGGGISFRNRDFDENSLNNLNAKQR